MVKFTKSVDGKKNIKGILKEVNEDSIVVEADQLINIPKDKIKSVNIEAVSYTHLLLTDNIYLRDIEAPRVAKSAQPGQFIIIKNNEKGDRIPLTIADYNREEVIVTIVFQTVGYTTKELAKYEVGDYVKDFVGPLGQPSELIHEDLNHLKDKKLIFIAGGVGAAPVLSLIHI